MSETIHTFPVNDLVAHNCASDDCICGPDIEYVEGGGKLVVHHSLDGRELAEQNPVRYRRLRCCGVVADTLPPLSADLLWDVKDGEDYFWHKKCPRARDKIDRKAA